MIVDREDMERKLAPSRAALASRASAPGAAGLRARVGLATTALDDWYADEIARGSSQAEISTALVSRLGEIVGVTLASFRAESPKGLEHVAAVRASLVELLEISINKTLAAIDAMSTEELAQHSYAIHQEQ
ncbi:MAG: hypothetical protein J0I54_20490 [Bosea sp.]|uniref:hypothetical protein n=1 Tax=unclassified Bosea (in: a-proteobacteria) TaxID=2653178 RepID=UPI000960F974|nr:MULTISPECIES: hypothetical protein [unclassified Bosea (in: a-proteobacteria)]MBN9459018.1 hypothetical protein [Bosea sp. (in: a-proteobacteria)]OJV06239.1 MAG: hypothetical protein BGO20_08255 [Bosea sp. 67-29]